MSFFEKYTARWTDDSIRIINTPSQTAKSTFFYIQESGYFKTLPGYYTERTDLPSYLLLYTVSGKGILEYEGEKTAVLPGHVMFIDCMKHHRYLLAGNEPWEFYWVHFYGAVSDGYYSAFRSEHESVTGDASRSGIPEILQKIVEINRIEQRTTELMNSKLILDLITEMMVESLAYDDRAMPKFVHDAVKYIEKHFSENITLDQIAESLSISKYHLSREFKKYTGDSPGEYLIRHRINRSKELLKNTDLSISQIAGKVGIPAEHHFSMLFKSRTDETPRDFRKMWRSK